MAGDRQQFARMEAHYEDLQQAQAFSVAPEVGSMAVVTVYNPEKIGQVRRSEDSIDLMDREARRLQFIQESKGKSAKYFPRATAEDFWGILEDETISDITVIGLAQLGKVQIEPWSRETATPGELCEEQPVLSYFDAISPDGRRPTIPHLKSGSFHQRTSGLMPADINIPFAWGFMADRSKIWGSPQRGFYPKKKHDQPQDGLYNIAEHFGLAEEDLRGMTYVQAKEVFGPREAVERTAPRYPVPSFAIPAYNKLRDSERVRDAHNMIRRSLRAARLVQY